MLRPKLTKQRLYDLPGAIMENALFSTRSLRQSGRLWWKMGEQYSSTDLIPVQSKSTNIFTAHAEPKKKYIEDITWLCEDTKFLFEC